VTPTQAERAELLICFYRRLDEDLCTIRPATQEQLAALAGAAHAFLASADRRTRYLYGIELNDAERAGNAQRLRAVILKFIDHMLASGASDDHDAVRSKLRRGGFARQMMPKEDFIARWTETPSDQPDTERAKILLHGTRLTMSIDTVCHKVRDLREKGDIPPRLRLKRTRKPSIAHR